MRNSISFFVFSSSIFSKLLHLDDYIWEKKIVTLFQSSLEENIRISERSQHWPYFLKRNSSSTDIDVGLMKWFNDWKWFNSYINSPYLSAIVRIHFELNHSIPFIGNKLWFFIINSLNSQSTSISFSCLLIKYFPNSLKRSFETFSTLYHIEKKRTLPRSLIYEWYFDSVRNSTNFSERISQIF